MFAKQHIILSRPKATVILCIGVLGEIYSRVTIWPPQLLKFSPQWVGGRFHENHAISNNFSCLRRDNKVQNIGICLYLRINLDHPIRLFLYPLKTKNQIFSVFRRYANSRSMKWFSKGYIMLNSFWKVYEFRQPVSAVLFQECGDFFLISWQQFWSLKTRSYVYSWQRFPNPLFHEDPT